MRHLFAPLATALCLAATPALAQSVTDDTANAMLVKLSTPAFDTCTESDEAKRTSAPVQNSACRTALAELGQTRRSNPRATAGEKQVYLFVEIAIEMGHTVSLLRLDGKPTARVCTNIERQWALGNQIDTAVVGPDLKDALVSTREGVRGLVKTCRNTYPAPAGALPA